MSRRSAMTLSTIVALAAATFLLGAVDCQLSDNTPPTVYLNRNWVLKETDPVGYVVERVRAEDNDQGELIYGLEPSTLNYNGNAEPQRPLPFAINSTTGVIYLNETLKGRGGQHMSLYVTVSNGIVPAKAEVYVNIQRAAGSKTGPTRSPFSNQPGNGGLIRPPILRLPSLTIPPSSSQSQPQQPPSRTRLKPEFASSSPGTSTSLDDRRDDAANDLEAPALSSKVEPSEAPPSQDITMTLVPIAAVCALVFGLGMGVWSLRKRICASRKSKEQNEHASVSVSTISNDPSLDLKRWRSPKVANNRYEVWDKEAKPGARIKRDDKWEFPRHRLKVFNILGEGCFGQVWKCEALEINATPGTTIVAVKTLKENATERERLDLAQELKVMKSLEPHPNVVRLLGCCTEREPMFVILEYVSGGKLQSFLRASREERNQGGPGLTSRDLTSFVYQVAKGMEYLASKGVIHRDLAARNVLIDDNRVCKVADFGFARDVAANQIYERKSEGRLPIRWMAPESLYDNIFSVKSDIWSFGVLIWEIVTLGSTPYPGLAAAEVMRRIKEGYRLDRPEHCKRELYNIMYYCWDKDPACRPSFTELVNLAEGLLLDETDYIELDRFPDHSYYNVLNLSGEKL
ncbi:tyrosine kinase receptor Cad96Ca isoform X2 [Nasonia vitripennis]|uniref:receptor protein-tyrosine kinase n=1 Tax=Nasonia vitripennis TaxID=7425 RepID=A0A7M7IU48_NASVI|nr:tyrosine kinase receptor Cad96Ca isoform X2 [Nasonia vitripennis]